MFASFMGTKPASSSQASFIFTAPDSLASWESLEQQCNERMKEAGVNLWPEAWLAPDAPTNPHAAVRAFGQPESSIRVTLYRDHAAWCPYCQKVWLQLEEKRIPYRVQKINMRAYGNKPPEFMAKVPGGLLPVIELDGQVITESAVIMQILEETFPDHKPMLPPPGSEGRARADLLFRLERQLFSDWLGWLCNDWDHEGKMRRFERTMDLVAKEMDAEGGPFFLGEELSLVDVTFTSILERTAASLAYYKGYYIRGQGRWPAVERWFDALEQRPTYLGTKSDYYTHCHDLPPQLGGCAMAPSGVPTATALDGQNGGWKLPLTPLSATSMPEPHSAPESPALDRLEAASKVVRNRVNLTKFALRGPGKPGPKPVSAPLADPTAIPALEFSDGMDVAFRRLTHLLLEPSDASTRLQVQTNPSRNAFPSTPVIQGLEYVRDRVGVPRDLRLPAARHMRATINRLIDELTSP